MNQNIEQESNPYLTPAVKLACYAQTLTGERLVSPASPPVPLTRAVVEREEWERREREREQELLESLLVQMKRKARQRRRCVTVFLGAGGVALSLGVILMLNRVLDASLPALFVGTSATAFVSALWGVLLHAQMADLVAHLPTSDVRAVSPLLDALRCADMQGIPQRELRELLPRITPGDSFLFSGAHRQSLCRALLDADADLAVMLIHALEKIGDGRAIGIVEHLANGNRRARTDENVRAAAQRCLPILQARAVHDAASQTLLRPSMASNAEGEQLLRPYAGNADTRTRELLRAAFPYPSLAAPEAEEQPYTSR